MRSLAESFPLLLPLTLTLSPQERGEGIRAAPRLCVSFPIRRACPPPAPPSWLQPAARSIISGAPTAVALARPGSIRAGSFSSRPAPTRMRCGRWRRCWAPTPGPPLWPASSRRPWASPGAAASTLQPPAAARRSSSWARQAGPDGHRRRGHPLAHRRSPRRPRSFRSARTAQVARRAGALPPWPSGRMAHRVGPCRVLFPSGCRRGRSRACCWGEAPPPQQR